MEFHEGNPGSDFPPSPTPSSTPSPSATPTPSPTPPSAPGDGKIDQPSPSPSPSPTASGEVCWDGRDNDDDGLVDNNDPDCRGFGTAYFFSSSRGNDAWSGLLPEPKSDLSDGPKRSLAQVENYIRNVAQPGDAVLLRRGDEWKEHDLSVSAVRISSVQGTERSPIILGAYGDDPARPRLDIGGTGDLVISITGNSKYVIVKDLTLTTTAPLGSRPQGFNVLNCVNDVRPEHIILDNLEVINLRYGGTIQGNYVALKNSIIKNNFKQGPLEAGGHTQGLYVGHQCGGGNFVTIEGNWFENNGSKESVYDWNTYLSCSDCSFERNYVTDGSAGLKLRKCTRVTVRDNIFSDIDSVGISLGADNDGVSEDTLIERNLIRRTIDGITVVRQSTGFGDVRNVFIRNNILMDNLPRPVEGGDYRGYLTFSTADGHTDVLIAHNSLVNIRHKAAVQINLAPGAGPAPQQNVKITNNIFQMGEESLPALDLTGTDSSLLSVDGNMYDAAIVAKGNGGVLYTSLADLSSEYSGWEDHGLEAELLFDREESDLGELPFLPDVSAARDSAVCLSEVREDFFRSQRPTVNCDFGAEEG